MAKIEHKGNYGDQMHGVIVQPHQVSVVGVVDAAGRFLIAVRVLNDAGDTLTIALPLDFEPTFRRMLKEQAAEMRDIKTAPRS